MSLFFTIFFLFLIVGCNSQHLKGCLFTSGLCPTPNELCLDDGIFGKCLDQSLFEGLQPQRLQDDNKNQLLMKLNLKDRKISTEIKDSTEKLLRHFILYLIDNGVDTNKISRSRLRALMRAFLYKTNKDKQEWARKLLSTINSVQHLLESRGISLSDLTDLELEVLSHLIAKMFIRREETTGWLSDYHNLFPNQHQLASRIYSAVDGFPDNFNLESFKQLSPSLHSEQTSFKELRNSQHRSKQQKIDNPENDASSQLLFTKSIKSEISRSEVVSEKSDFKTITTQTELSTVFHPILSQNVVQTPLTVAELLPVLIIVVVVFCITFFFIIFHCVRSVRAVDKEDKPNGRSPMGRSGRDYQELCRQHFVQEQTKLVNPSDENSTSKLTSSRGQLPSNTLSTTSWCEEPVSHTLDISMAHAILTYMEDHVSNKERLDEEWEALCRYKADNVSFHEAQRNWQKNRSDQALPYDHNRVIINSSKENETINYINASFIIDNDPRSPLYIAAQGPLPTSADEFWQMIWEQACVAIVMLTPLVEETSPQCARYWPDEGSVTYNTYEIHLVSEHIWCENYLVRSLYIKNHTTGETRTLTQFHFLSWPHDSVPPSAKHLLEMRRKVSKCYRSSNRPVLVHCSDGVGRTGTYILLDLVINRMLKGAKEIDIAATLEHLRDQRDGFVSSKEQLQFALASVADEVNAILKKLLNEESLRTT